MLAQENPFAVASQLPYGLPPFDRITDEHYRPAFDAGFAEQVAEIEAIVNNPEPATFDNVVVALERSGQLLLRVQLVFYNLAGSNSSPEIRAIRAEIAPRVAAHEDAIYLDARLYQKVAELFSRRETLGLDAESLRLLERVHTNFRRAGAGLSDEDQQKLRSLNEKLSSLETIFGENILSDTNDLAVLVDDRAELAGLSEDAVDAAAEAAKVRGESGKYLLKIGLPTLQPVLASLDNRALRERVYKASISRSNRDNDWDNKDNAIQIATLRAEHAALLGFPHHAAYIIEDSTAKSAEVVADLLNRLAPSAVANAKAEAEELQRYLEADTPGAKLKPWDWSYYAEKIRRDQFDIDDSTLRPYFELDRVLEDGVFYAAERLYGLSFTERHDLPKYHPEVRIFEVGDADGQPVGLFVGDFFTRDAKRGGAWMNSLVKQSELFNTQPVVVNNLNIAHAPEGQPTLLTFDEVNTLFHEFGHALHGLMSKVKYRTFSGTSVPRDFVEFPSQVNEMWMLWPEVLANYAKHYQTGEPLPQQLVTKLIESRQYGEGFATTEYLAASLLDQAWHRLEAGDRVESVEEFQNAALEKAGVALSTISPRYRTTYFNHVFAAGYSAGYYSYIWSEVLDADTVEWFTKNGGLNRESGDRFRHELLAKGGSVDAMEAFRAVLGRDPEIAPLLRRRGLSEA